MTKFTRLEVYCAVPEEWSTPGEISKNLFNLTGEIIWSSNIYLHRDLEALEEIGYIESKRNPRGKIFYKLSDNLEIARRRINKLKRAS